MPALVARLDDETPRSRAVEVLPQGGPCDGEAVGDRRGALASAE